MKKKRVYTFGNGAAEGRADMKNLLGGKGANLAEMNLIGVPVPPGFTITSEVCTEYNELGKDYVINVLKNEVEKAIKGIESQTGTKFGDKENPCLVSVRSGARVSMPGMMDTVLNLGLNDDAVQGIANKSGNERFAWDSYRRFVQMYGDVVLGMKPQSKEDIDPFEEIMDDLKEEKGIKLDTDFTVEDLKLLVQKFKTAVKERTGNDFPTSPWDQLWGAICAVFDSWMNDRAILYRKMNNFPEEWGTAVNVQSMVYGNMGQTSGTGVAFTRDAATGEDIFNGEYLINAQGEDVVAGVRTPLQITTEGSRRWAKMQGISEEDRALKYPSLEEAMPVCAKELIEVQQKLEDYFKDMQDLEFTIQDGKLWLLQTRNGKRTGSAMVKIAIDMLNQGYIDEKTAEIKQYNEERGIDSSIPVNGRRLTNIGVFRKYMELYLKNNPKINQEATCMVRQLQPTERGIPMEIYCFSNEKTWVLYEGVQADIFDHVFAIVPEFGLKLFQNPSGDDFRALTQG